LIGLIFIVPFFQRYRSGKTGQDFSTQYSVTTIHEISHLNDSKMSNLKKNQVRLNESQPDSCYECPLLGLIPEGKRDGKWTHVCCATGDALTGRGIKVKASTKDAKHKWHRPCDGIWESWWNASPHHVFTIPLDRYITWRQPYSYSLGLTINFPKRRK
jgi:hypothetical protein